MFILFEHLIDENSECKWRFLFNSTLNLNLAFHHSICTTLSYYKQVVATNTIKPQALESGVTTSLATEKLDGTCCYVRDFEGIDVQTLLVSLVLSQRKPDM